MLSADCTDRFSAIASSDGSVSSANMPVDRNTPARFHPTVIHIADIRPGTPENGLEGGDEGFLGNCNNNFRAAAGLLRVRSIRTRHSGVQSRGRATLRFFP